MAVVNLLSTQLTNRDATPVVLNNPLNTGSRLSNSKGLITTGTADSIASIYRMCTVPTGACIESLLLSCAAIATAPAGDIGVYRTTADGSAVVSVAFFASAQLFSSALYNTEILNESTTNTPAKQLQPLWQALGVATDPGGFYDICITLTVATTAAGDIALKAIYSM